MEIIKHDLSTVLVEKTYEGFSGDLERTVFKDLYVFIKENDLLMFSWNTECFQITTMNDYMHDRVIVKAIVPGRFKTEDEKYSDCLEYMISNL